MSEHPNSDTNQSQDVTVRIAAADNAAAGETLIDWINARRSHGNLQAPGPTTAQIKAAIGCAACAPDHKKLQPWRFIVTRGAARDELGQALMKAAKDKALREGESVSEKTLSKAANLPLRAPVIITVVTHIQPHEKVPPYEQLLSAGAAVQNLLLALKAQGYSSVWRTGLLSNEPAVKAYFDITAGDYVTAFVYTGSSAIDEAARDPIDIEALVRFES